MIFGIQRTNDRSKSSEKETQKVKIEKGQNNFIVILDQFMCYVCCALQQVFDNPTCSRRDWGWQPQRSNLKTYNGVNRSSKQVLAIVYRRWWIESQPKRGRNHWARHRDLHVRSDHVLGRSIRLWTSHLFWSQHSKLNETIEERRRRRARLSYRSRWESRRRRRGQRE